MQIRPTLGAFSRHAHHGHERAAAVDEHPNVAKPVGPELAKNRVRLDALLCETHVFELVREGAEHDVGKMFAELRERDHLPACPPPRLITETLTDDDDAVAAGAMSG